MSSVADLVFLSLWLRDYNESNMLQHWKCVIEAFPVSGNVPGIRSLVIYPFQWAETPVFERSFGEGFDVDEAVRLATEFLHEDYAYEAELHWDLWLPDPSGRPEIWRRTSNLALVSCLGPEFEREGTEDRADIQVNFGLDTLFLPPEGQPYPLSGQERGVADLRTRENLQHLVEFVHKLDQSLSLVKRFLWCESGENLAEKILANWDDQN